MKKVYFKRIDSYLKTEDINKAAYELLEQLVQDESISLESFIPMKVTFGEKGNRTYITPNNFKGIIRYLKENRVDSAFIETNVLYRGERTTKTKHKKLAEDHGFTDLPVIIADGEYGDEYENVEINKKHFKSCKIGKEIANKKQIIVLTHFKGHMLAGYGGAIKQLGMGCASRGGKLDQHANSIPKVSYFKCKSCKVCSVVCPEKAITMNNKAKIIKDKCVGCASCMAACPHGAISNSWLQSLTRDFNEQKKLALDLESMNL